MTARPPLARIAGDREIITRGDKREPELADVFAAIEVLSAKVDELLLAVAPELATRASFFMALRDTFGDTAFAAIDVVEAAAAHPRASSRARWCPCSAVRSAALGASRGAWRS